MGHIEGAQFNGDRGAATALRLTAWSALLLLKCLRGHEGIIDIAHVSSAHLMTSFARLIRILLLSVFACCLLGSLSADFQVNGYTRRDGTYVAQQTRPTGQAGRKPGDPAAGVVSPKTNDFALRANFSLVSVGMSAGQVTGLAGAPQLIRGSTWVYRDGSVEFAASKLVSRVTRYTSYPPAVSSNVGVGGLSSSSPANYGQTTPKETWVNGYTRADGTRVAGYYRTAANGTVNDNYSTQGNINPHTGKAGTQPRDSSFSDTPATHADGTPAHARNSPSRRAELKSIILIQNQIIDRHTKQTAFATAEGGRVSDADYEAAKEARRLAQRELDLMPQW
jgi:hypothetical protein